MTDRISHGWLAFLAIAMGLVLMLTGCASRRGNETAALAGRLATAQAATEKARGDGKAVKRILSRVDSKAAKILRLLGEEP